MLDNLTSVTRRPYLLAGLFVGTVVVVALILIFKVGPTRILAAEADCPAEPAIDYTRLYEPKHSIPDLCAAAGMRPREGVIHILRRSTPARAYIATEIRANCVTAQPRLCSAQLGDPELERAIDLRLDAALPPSIKDSHDFTSADVTAILPFYWSGFIALRSNIGPYAVLNLGLSDSAVVTREQVETLYGPASRPQINAQGYLALEYPGTGRGYVSKITALVNPTTARVQSFMVSVTRQ